MSIADDLLPDCTVRIDVRATPAGSGFFVGRGLIVTCAHVVESPADPSKAVAASDIRAVITPKDAHDEALPEQEIAVDVRQFAPHPDCDLAVLMVKDPFESPSVLLHGGKTLRRDDLHTFAYPEKKKRGVPRPLTADGVAGDGLVSFSEGQIQSGMSGSPLLNLRTGGVSGVISISRDRRQALGGYAIPIRRLLKLDPKIRGANAQAHDSKSAWVQELTIEQRQGWQSGRAIDSASEVQSFTVSFGQTADGWRVTTRDAGGERGLEEWVDLNAVREEIARLFRDWASRGRVLESEQLGLLGGILFSAAFPRSIGQRLRELTRNEGEPVVVNLRFESGLNTRVIELPWEHLCIAEEAGREVYLATDARFGLARVMTNGSSRNHEGGLPDDLSVALVAVHGAEPAAHGAPTAEAGTAGVIVDRVKRLAIENPGLRAVEIHNPEADDLDDFLSESTPTVLHYVGGGRFNEGRDELMLGPAGALQHSPVEVLIDALPEPRPRLVILQMVGLPPSDAAPADFSVFAPALIECGVDAVLAFQYPVDKPSTTRFNNALYEGLLAGQSVEVATQGARGAMRHYGGGRSFVSPALFLARPGPLLLCLATASAEQGITATHPSSYATANA